MGGEEERRIWKGRRTEAGLGIGMMRKRRIEQKKKEGREWGEERGKYSI